MRYLSALPTALLAPLLASLLAAGCCCNNKNDQTATRYHEDGRAKPITAVPAMIDTTSFDAPWSIAEELTSSIVQTMSGGGRIYIQSRDDFAVAENPFSNDLSWMKQEFQNQEFAVFLELVEHELVPSMKAKNSSSPQEISNNLNMAIRIRVVDLRGSAPKIVLQEMVRDSYYIPKTLLPTDYSVTAWGTEDYPKTPMGIAHAQIAQEIAARISDYILLAKSR